MVKIIKNNISIIFLFLTASVVFGLNHYGFPYFEGDEGIYASRAWAFVTEGRLTTETYWYDHPPLGWIFLSIWFKLTGGVNWFEFLLTSGRTFIYLLAVLNSLLIYFISKKVFSRELPAVLTSLLFITSPLQIYFGRRILLDNIMIFWTLLSLYSFFYIENKTIRVIVNAFILSIAVLTKENAILFALPVFLLIHWFTDNIPNISTITNKWDKKFNIIWILTFTTILAVYPLIAIIRNEFLPSDYFKTGRNPSLLSTLFYQAGRGETSIFDLHKSPFWQNLIIWYKEDPLIIIAGTISTFINLLLYKKHKLNFIIGLFSLVQIAFIMRGGVVFEFYILSVLPFLVLNIMTLLDTLSKNIKPGRFLSAKILNMLPILSLILIGYNAYSSLSIKNQNPYLAKQTQSQILTFNYIFEDVRDNGIIISDSFAKADLYKLKHIIIKSHFDAHYDDDFKNGVRSNQLIVDYILVTRQVERDIRNNDLTFISELLNKSTLLRTFERDGWSVKIFKPL